jgi:hypothetical protein
MDNASDPPRSLALLAVLSKLHTLTMDI